jgi:mannose-6-phosphate isomerase-like protein (cupin superfamily)
MSDVAVKRLEDIAHYTGPGALAGIRFRAAGRALGVSAWGMNAIEIEAGCTSYPEHDHARDGQEEVYAVLSGGGTLEAGGEQIPLAPGVLVRVGPLERRKIVPGPQGITVLAIGATPGKAYERRH